MQTYPVWVVNEAGEPVAGSRVELIRKGTRSAEELIRKGPRPLEVDTPTNRPRESRWYMESGHHELISEGETDAMGQVLLPVPAARHELNLRVTGDGHMPAIERNVQFSGDGSPVVLVVSQR